MENLRGDVWVRLPSGELKNNICGIAGVSGDVYANLRTFECRVLTGDDADAFRSLTVQSCKAVRG